MSLLKTALGLVDNTGAAAGHPAPATRRQRDVLRAAFHRRGHLPDPRPGLPAGARPAGGPPLRPGRCGDHLPGGQGLACTSATCRTTPCSGGRPRTSTSIPARRLPIDNKSIAGYVALTGESLLIDDVYHIQSERLLRLQPRVRPRAPTARIHPGGAPDHARQEMVGVLQLINAKAEAGEVGGLLHAGPALHLPVRAERRGRHREGPPVAGDGAAHGGAGRAARPLRDQPARQAGGGLLRGAVREVGRPPRGAFPRGEQGPGTSCAPRPSCTTWARSR